MRKSLLTAVPLILCLAAFFSTYPLNAKASAPVNDAHIEEWTRGLSDAECGYRLAGVTSSGSEEKASIEDATNGTYVGWLPLDSEVGRWILSYIDPRGRFILLEDHGKFARLNSNPSKASAPPQDADDDFDESQARSLPEKLALFTAEASKRAEQINARDKAINALLTEIQALSNGRYNLSAYMLPTGIGVDAASQARIQTIIDSNLLGTLNNQLLNISAATTHAADQSLAPTTSTNSLEIALLAITAGARIGSGWPLPGPGRTDSSVISTIMRYEYSTAAVKTIQDALSHPQN